VSSQAAGPGHWSWRLRARQQMTGQLMTLPCRALASARGSLARVSCAAAGVALTASGLAVTVAASAAPAGSSWPSAPPPVYGVLHSVAATSAGNAWAVGHQYNLNILTLHWNGTAWKPVPSPSLPGNLLSVAATSARNAWAVGYTGGAGLILHWNGTAWKRVPSPSPPGNDSLSGVAATSARNAWAVGTEILHWNGTAWKQQARNQSFGLLTGVAATSARNAWAVGYFCTAKCGQHTSVIVIVHWNGTAWKAVTTLPARSR
jgi:hypothetical protein